jgi:hypothetical protein
MSGRPKYVVAYTPPRRDVLLEQQAKHRRQIINAASAARRFAAQAEATGALSASERQQLASTLSWLDSAAATPTAATADRAADEMRRASEIAIEADRRAAEIRARARELTTLDRACAPDLTQLADTELRKQGLTEQARLAELRARLAAGGLRAAEATEQRLAREATLAQLASAQSRLDLIDKYVADLSRLGIDCAVEHRDVQQRIRGEPSRAHALTHEFEELMRTRISEWAQVQEQKEAQAVSARYAQWGELQTRLQDRKATVDAALQSSEAEAPDAAKTVTECLKTLRIAVDDLGQRWDLAEAEGALADLETALAALGKAVESQRYVRAAVSRRAAEHTQRLREKLDAALGLEGPDIGRIESELAKLPHLASAEEVEHRSRQLEADVDQLAAAAAKPGPDMSAQEAVIKALTKLGDQRRVRWDDPEFAQLCAARLGDEVTISGQFDGDGSSINLSVRLSQDGGAIKDAAGTKVEITCNDGEGPSCDLVKGLPRELYETKAFVEARGEAKDETEVWMEVHNARSAEATGEDMKRKERARTI